MPPPDRGHTTPWDTFIQPESISPDKRLSVVVRPDKWFDSLGELIDSGIRDLSQDLILQISSDAIYITNARNDDAEQDIETLLAEVR
ncbi:MAG: hypothetical protein M3Y07_15910, partial [Acidobacteriota bacterium]|nr:hypothetical protein [Acidobacteriota bacterium]